MYTVVYTIFPLSITHLMCANACRVVGSKFGTVKNVHEYVMGSCLQNLKKSQIEIEPQSSPQSQTFCNYLPQVANKP